MIINTILIATLNCNCSIFFINSTNINLDHLRKWNDDKNKWNKNIYMKIVLYNLNLSKIKFSFLEWTRIYLNYFISLENRSNLNRSIFQVVYKITIRMKRELSLIPYCIRTLRVNRARSCINCLKLRSRIYSKGSWKSDESSLHPPHRGIEHFNSTLFFFCQDRLLALRFWRSTTSHSRGTSTLRR